jgi:Flp pilus assembly protein TadG
MKRITSTNRNLSRRRQRGQSIVEFALMAPILILLFMGMFDFGWILHKQIQMDNATRSGARRGAVGDSNTSIKNAMVNSVTFPLTVSDITIQVLDPAGNPVGDSNDRTPDNIIKVSINFNDVQLITPLAALVEGMGQINLHSEAKFLIE